ncbi:hypothetical protein [Cognaticolwellia mytili]|uniref:hypothetical protein n=1 Tax=Cognaticolwellia mytili TaxID=1888913 RepID=UPI000A1748E4|nr:hypothetical protein [Cognaticolwellia mytili]
MNISHTQENIEQQENEFSYITSKNIAKQAKPMAKSNEVIMSKILELLEDSTSNHVLGYN